MLSEPPATPTLASSSIKDWATETIACAPDPQRRLTFMAETVLGMPACIAETLDRYMSLGSVLMTCPKATCSTSSA